MSEASNLKRLGLDRLIGERPFVLQRALDGPRSDSLKTKRRERHPIRRVWVDQIDLCHRFGLSAGLPVPTPHNLGRGPVAVKAHRPGRFGA